MDLATIIRGGALIHLVRVILHHVYLVQATADHVPRVLSFSVKVKLIEVTGSVDNRMSCVAFLRVEVVISTTITVLSFSAISRSEIVVIRTRNAI